MAEVSTGTVTFLFADIADSARLWEQHQHAMPMALARYADLMNHAVESYGGTLFQVAGEARRAAFAVAADALAAALAAQRAIQAEDWYTLGLPREHPLRARIALHSGAAKLRDGIYTGPLVYSATQLRAAGHGGQILLSGASQELVGDQLPPDAALRDLGQHHLKDLSGPMQIFQVIVPDLRAYFPQLNTLDRHPTNLPAQPSSLIGREREIAAVCALLRHPDVRLLTLTGPGGTGKTRLGLQVAAELMGEQEGCACFADGIYVVALAAIGAPELIIPSVAQTLGLQEAGGQPIFETLKSYLHDKKMLLLLDNFEHVAAAAPQIAVLAAAARGLKVLITSRAVLHLSGEHEYAVPPLALPDLAHLPAADILAEYSAIALFIQRAQAARPDFAVTSANAPAVAEICARLDGLPLAIELAAARVKLFSPEALLARLTSRLTLLTGGPRDLPARQQTLRGAIDWSYNLLDAAEQTLFRRLAVFAGGCTLEAATAVCADQELRIEDRELKIAPPSSIFYPPSSILDGVAALVDKSLLRQEQNDGEPRFVMLETIREYALEQLTASGERAIAGRQHAQFFLSLAEVAEPQLTSHQQRVWLERLEQEHDNLRAALTYCLEARDLRLGACDQNDDETSLKPQASSLTEIGLRLAGALCWFWFIRGHCAEGCNWLHDGLAVASIVAPGVRAKAYSAAGTLAFNQTDLDQSAVFHEQALALYQELGDRRGIAFTLNNLGGQAIWLGDPARADTLLVESLSGARSIGDRWLIATILNNMGIVAREQGDSDRALACYQESLALSREQGDRTMIATLLFNSAEVLADLGDYLPAAMHLEEALGLSREQGNKLTSAFALQMLGRIARAQGRPGRAAALYEESLTLFQEVGFKRGVAEGLEGLAALAADDGVYVRAAQLYGTAEILRETSGGTPIAPIDRPAHDRTVGMLRRRLGAAAFAGAWAGGRAMTPKQALTTPAQVAPVFPPAPTAISLRTPRGGFPAGLTEREVEVLRLLAEGLSYAQIAERLTISSRTVNHHLTSIYNKLDVTSRHAAMQFAIDQQLV